MCENQKQNDYESFLSVLFIYLFILLVSSLSETFCMLILMVCQAQKKHLGLRSCKEIEYLREWQKKKKGVNERSFQ